MGAQNSKQGPPPVPAGGSVTFALVMEPSHFMPASAQADILGSSAYGESMRVACAHEHFAPDVLVARVAPNSAHVDRFGHAACKVRLRTMLGWPDSDFLVRLFVFELRQLASPGMVPFAISEINSGRQRK